APSFGVIELANGNYLVTQNGAVTFGSGKTGITGTVTAANSLMGVGVDSGGITLLPNGNYLVSSPFVTVNGLAEAGAVTFGNGLTGVTGAITAQNSLVGAHAGDLIGFNFLSLVLTPVNPTQARFFQTLIAQGDLTGRVSTTPITTIPADLAAVGVGLNTTTGIAGAIAVLANGDYVVSSPFASGFQGAATFGNGATGVTGLVTPQNSVFGQGFGVGFANFIQDNPANGTFVVSAERGNGAVTVAAGSGKGIGTLLSFGSFPNQSITVSTQALEQVLATGTAVRLEANNDITVANPILVQGGGHGGALTLDAGRSIFINAPIHLDHGALTLIVDDGAAIAADRGGGPGLLRIAPGVALDAGPGSSVIQDGFTGPNDFALTPFAIDSQILSLTGNETQPFFRVRYRPSCTLLPLVQPLGPGPLTACERDLAAVRKSS
ncbi:MAG TPA: hypothetical protein VKT70_07680, partial [Stellaceae bacterium]|nr:hypothetical protein [Stellaceae bacterium]